MAFTYFRRAAVALALLAMAGCTVKSTDAPPLTGPSGLALTLTLNAVPDSISQDGGSQSSVKVQAIGPDGKGVAGVSLRLDMSVAGVAQDYGTLSARSVVTNADGIATAIYTAPPSLAGGSPCSNLSGNCVAIVATATSTNFANANPEQVTIRLVPTGVILPPAAAPTAAFTYSPTPASVGLVIHFDASSSKVGTGASQITSYAWDFGDGTTSTGKAPTHTFNAAATYNVTLTVTNDRALSSSTTQAVAVAAAAAATDALPTPSFTFSPASPGVNQTVFFNGSSSKAGAGHTISSYSWDFGDGGSGSGVNPSHAYNRAGTFNVTLVVTDDIGQAVASAATAVAVSGTSSQIVADFTFSPTDPKISGVHQVFFDATPSSSPNTITSYVWDFGDGSAAGSGQKPNHTYSNAQTYVIRLTVTDSAGGTATTTKTITVGS